MTREQITEKINKYTFSDFADQKNQQELLSQTTNSDLEVVDCYLVAKLLEAKVDGIAEFKQAENKETYYDYLSIIGFFRLRCFMNLSKEEAASFMKNLVVAANRLKVKDELTWDFKENLYASLDPIYDLDGNKKEVLLENLKQNQELIGDKKLKFAGQNSQQDPSLKNWLKDYDISAKIEESRTSLDRLNYLNSSQLVKDLSEVEKNVLTILLEVYDILRFFTHKLEIRKTADFWEAQASKIGAKESSKDELVALYKQIKESILTEDYLATSENLSEDNLENLIKNIQSFILEGNETGVLAGLDVLAEKENLEKFLKSADKLNEGIKEYIDSRFNKQISKNLDFSNPGSPLISLWLQYILLDRLKIAPDRSAVFVMTLANLLPEGKKNKLLSLAYGDVVNRQFRWREIIIKNNQLEFSD